MHTITSPRRLIASALTTGVLLAASGAALPAAHAASARPSAVSAPAPVTASVRGLPTANHATLEFNTAKFLHCVWNGGSVVHCFMIS